MSTRAYIAGAVVVVAVAGFVVWRMFFAFPQNAPVPGAAGKATHEPAVSSGSALSSALAARTPPPGFKEYKSTFYHVSFFYPQELKVSEHPGASDTMAVTFEYTSGQNVSGFELYMLPYSEPKISDARFKKDVPSGVRDNLQNIKVGGATAASFDSTDASLGDTHEVWFVHGNYLYELTTFRQLGAMLDAVASSTVFF